VLNENYATFFKAFKLKELSQYPTLKSSTENSNITIFYKNSKYFL